MTIQEIPLETMSSDFSPGDRAYCLNPKTGKTVFATIQKVDEQDYVLFFIESEDRFFVAHSSKTAAMHRLSEWTKSMKLDDLTVGDIISRITTSEGIGSFREYFEVVDYTPAVSIKLREYPAMTIFPPNQLLLKVHPDSDETLEYKLRHFELEP